MREVNAKKITEVVRKMCIDSNYYLTEDVLKALDEGEKKEESPLGKRSSSSLRRTSVSPGKSRWPFVRIQAWPSYSSNWPGGAYRRGDFNEAIHEGVRQGYKDGYLRKSSCHPFTGSIPRTTPGHYPPVLVPGIKSKSSRAQGEGGKHVHGVMLSPSDGIEGVKNRVVEWVKQAGSNPCRRSSWVVGGTFEEVALTAKKRFFRPWGRRTRIPTRGDGEELLTRVNNLESGPRAGGRITALAVNVELIPAYRQLPMAVNLNCHAHRHQKP